MLRTQFRLRRALALTVSLAAVTTALLGPAGAPSGAVSASAPKPAPLRYVALGDSYSAASGVLPPDPAAPVECLRSTRNYPHLIAARTGARLTDVTCGGAETGDFFTPQYDNQPAQLKALSRRTQLVTMTIGGNDSGVFINSIVQCGVAGASTAGMGSPCKDQYGNSFERTVRRKTFPSLVRALNGVHRRAPHARVAILGYPSILPKRVGCFDKMPVARGDVPYLHSLQRTLNNVVRRAAHRTDTRFIGFGRASRGHDACQPIGTRWIEPVLQGTNPVIVHPNALGERRLAQRTVRVLHLRRR